MKSKVEHIKNGIITWYTAEVAPISWKLFYALPLIKITLSNAEKQHASVIKGLTDEQGYIDIDELHKEYSLMITQSGGMVNIGPLQKITIQDLDKLVAYIKQATPPQPTTQA